MKEFVRYIIISLTAIFAVGMTSCYDDTFDFDGANEISLKVNATTCFSGVDARSILDETKPVAISNYCLLIFDKKATDGKLFFAKDLGSSLSSSVVTFPLTTDFYNGQAYYAVLFGNVTLSQLGLTEGTSTVSTLFTKMATVSTGDNKFTDASKFTWSAFKEISISSANLNFTLNPNMAKVKVTIRNNSANSERTQLLSVQVKNVANKVRYAQNALSDAGLFTVSDNKAAFSAGTVSNINYNSESINLAPGGSPISFTWYIPHNELNQKQSSGSRAERADANATYIEIKGVRGADFMDNLYKIYLGKNETNTSYDNFSNYHVSADTQYNLNIIINDDGLTYSGNNNVSDKGGATQALGVVKLPAGSNCYMIHPKGTATAGGTIYELPLDQINRYWRDVVGDANRTLSATTKWRPVHIWQDMDKQAICFCDENGNDITKYVSPEYTTDLFTGNKPIRFKIKNNDAYGNVIIGVLFDGVSGFLWSWHLWITDYNPDTIAVG